MKKLERTRYSPMVNPHLGKLVGPHLRIFVLYKRNNPFGPKLLNFFLNLLANILYNEVTNHFKLFYLDLQLINFV